MSKKNHVGNEGVDDSKPNHKGEIKQSQQKGAPSVSKKGSGKHYKDHSGKAAVEATDPDNTTKKQQNSI